jgi:hypothetical protein
MNTRILLLVLGVAALSSCSSVYKSGQTPDDVYFSPARPQADEYVDVNQDKNQDRYQSYEEYQDNMRNDRFLRMSVGNPYYLNTYNSFDGFDWRYNSYNMYGYNSYSFNSPWNSYYAWNSFYNPYCMSPYIYYGGGYYGNVGSKLSFSTPVSRPIAFNINSYSNNSGNRPSRTLSGNYNNSNTRYNNSNGSNNRYNNYSNSNYTNSVNRSNNGYSPSSNSSNSNSTPSRSYTPSSSGSSSGGGGGGGGVSRPGRGGR